MIPICRGEILFYCSVLYPVFPGNFQKKAFRKRHCRLKPAGASIFCAEQTVQKESFLEERDAKQGSRFAERSISGGQSLIRGFLAFCLSISFKRRRRLASAKVWRDYLTKRKKKSVFLFPHCSPYFSSAYIRIISYQMVKLFVNAFYFPEQEAAVHNAKADFDCNHNQRFPIQI